MSSSFIIFTFNADPLNEGFSVRYLHDRVCRLLQEMQSKFDAIKRELDEQRERDGGVFISQDRKDELEKKALELEVLKKQFDDLSVSLHSYFTYAHSDPLYTVNFFIVRPALM